MLMDNVIEIRWCWCWKWLWNEMTLMLVMSLKWDDDNAIEMKWCWCWKWHWDERMLMMIMSLRCDDVDVKNDIEMRWCWCWQWHWDEMLLMLKMWLWWCMLCMYMGSAMTMMDIPDGGNIVVKEFWASLERNSLESLIIYNQCIDGAHVSYFILHEKSINFVSKYL